MSSLHFGADSATNVRLQVGRQLTLDIIGRAICAAGATLKPGLPVIKTEDNGQERVKHRDGVGSKRPVQFNTLDAIAAAIAGVDSPSGAVPDLAAAVKRKLAKKPKS